MRLLLLPHAEVESAGEANEAVCNDEGYDR